MSEIHLNKFEKERRVIELHLAGKTIRDITKEVHMSFRDISKIIKKYERKIILQQNKKSENNPSNKIKKLSKSSQAYELLLKGRTPVQVAIDLDLDFPKVRNYWTEFLRLQNMKKLYNIYIESEFHLESLFRIYYWMLRNEIPVRDMENVLRTAKDVINLNQTIINLKAEIEKLKQTKNNYSLKPLLPLRLPAHYYRYYYNY